jgi:hypothetical protein
VGNIPTRAGLSLARGARSAPRPSAFSEPIGPKKAVSSADAAPRAGSRSAVRAPRPGRKDGAKSRRPKYPPKAKRARRQIHARRPASAACIRSARESGTLPPPGWPCSRAGPPGWRSTALQPWDPVPVAPPPDRPVSAASAPVATSTRLPGTSGPLRPIAPHARGPLLPARRRIPTLTAVPAPKPAGRMAPGRAIRRPPTAGRARRRMPS